MPKNVLIAESNAYFSEILSGLLAAHGLTVVGETSRKSEVAALVRDLLPNLLIFDFSLSVNGMAGLSDLSAVKEDHPELKILVLGFQDVTDEFVSAVLTSGCDGYWNKFDHQAGLLENLNRLLA